MKTGLVILNYNDFETVVTLADTAGSYPAIEHIAIVDNASADDSYERLSARYRGRDNISVISSGRNGGFSYGNNFGARYLMDNYKVDLVAVSNPDVMFDESLIIAISEAFEKNRQYGVLTGIMTTPDGEVDKAPYREFFSYLHDFGDCFLTVRRLVYEKRRFEIDYSVPIMKVPVIQGSFFVISAEAFNRIGGLDEKLFLYYEEMVLGKRLLAAGYDTGILTRHSYVHNHAVSIRKSMKNLKIWRTVLNSKYYYQKYYNNANAAQMALLHAGGFFSLAEKFLIEVFRCL